MTAMFATWIFNVIIRRHKLLTF